MVEFARKHFYHFYTEEDRIIIMDHKPLITFLNSNFIEGIYTRWATKLRLLNVCIQYIEERRTKWQMDCQEPSSSNQSVMTKIPKTMVSWIRYQDLPLGSGVMVWRIMRRWCWKNKQLYTWKYQPPFYTCSCMLSTTTIANTTKADSIKALWITLYMEVYQDI